MFAATLITLGAAEGIMRLCGMEAHFPNDYPIHSEPEFTLLPSVGYGFALNPGEFDVTVRDSLHFQVTHTSDSVRYTGKSGRKLDVHIHGCSYTYGFGVNDHEAFPYLLQEANSNWNIINYAVPGYGTIQSLLKLKDEVRKDNAPELVIIGYAGFHEDRNALTRIQRQAWKEAVVLTDEDYVEQFMSAAFPYGVITDDELQVKYHTMKDMYNHWPMRESSALVNWLESSYNNMQDRSSDKVEVTRKIFDEIAQVAENNEIRVVVAGLLSDETTLNMLDYCDELGLETVDIGVDISDTRYNFEPYDGHPNQLAHSSYFESLNTYLNKE